MSTTGSPAFIVARFLKANHYAETFEAFIKEAKLDEKDGDTKSGDWTIERILTEKVQYDKSLNFERTSNDVLKGWTVPAPSLQNESPDGGRIANILHASSSLARDRIVISSADRRWTELSASPPFNAVRSAQHVDNPILSSASLPGMTALTTMSGQLLLLNDNAGKVVVTRNDHAKYVVQVVVAKLSGTTWMLATASWDSTIKLYGVTVGTDDEDGATLNMWQQTPIPTIKLQSNPESILFVQHPDNDELYLVASRRDSTHLYYYSIDVSAGDESVVAKDAGRQNLAPHSNAWVAFTPSMLTLHPTDRSLIAVATSHLPHMKLVIVRLLFPGPEVQTGLSGTQASQARRALAVQDREDAAITLQVSTLAPQTPYSTPVVVWRPDGSGVWVNGDDGVVRGIDVKTGKVVTMLKGHEAGTKVRTLWAGEVADGEATREILVSGGFDKRVLIWTIDPSGT